MPTSFLSYAVNATHVIDLTLLVLQPIQHDLYHTNGHGLLMKSLELLYAELVEQDADIGNKYATVQEQVQEPEPGLGLEQGLVLELGSGQEQDLEFGLELGLE